MKIFVNHFDEKVFERKFEEVKDKDFSLFVDYVPQFASEFSAKGNFLVLQEPNEYFNLHNLAIQRKDDFDVIFTWDDKVLNNCENAVLLPFGHTWFKPEQYEKEHEKKYELTHLCGVLLKTYGHSLRHEILEREEEFIGIPPKFYKTYGDRNNIEDARKGKEELFGYSKFGIAIENTSHRNYFTEKILDCFLMKTIPFYWGCSNIGDYFNKDGIIAFQNVDDLIFKVNNSTELWNYYEDYKEVIEENYQLALQYVDYEQRICDNVIEILKYNNL